MFHTTIFFIHCQILLETSIDGRPSTSSWKQVYLILDHLTLGRRHLLTLVPQVYAQAYTALSVFDASLNSSYTSYATSFLTWPSICNSMKWKHLYPFLDQLTNKNGPFNNFL